MDKSIRARIDYPGFGIGSRGYPKGFSGRGHAVKPSIAADPERTVIVGRIDTAHDQAVGRCGVAANPEIALGEQAAGG